MPLNCPHCERVLPDPEHARQFCPHCGYGVAVLATDAYYIRDRVDFRLVAKWQRWLLWCVLAVVVADILMIPIKAGSWGPGVHILAMLTWLPLHILLDVCVIVMLATLRKHVVVIVLLGVLMLAPCVNLIFLLIANQMATAALRRVGLTVGFMGVKDEDVVR